MRCIHQVVFVFIFSTFLLQAQKDDYSIEINRSVKSLYVKYKNKDVKKTTRRFLRLTKSDNLSARQKKKIYMVLNNFEKRGVVGFRNYYVSFFDLVLGISDQNISNQNFNDILDFLTLGKSDYSNVDLKHFLKKTNSLIRYNYLNTSKYFTWQSSGDFYFDIDSNKKPFFYFNDSELSLYNDFDTINLFKISGYYDLLNNRFRGSYGEVFFSSESFSIYCQLDDFDLDLNKKSFKINEVNFFSEGSFRVNSSGFYSDKLTSLDDYPVFKSYSDESNIELFEGVKLFSGVKVQGDEVFFKKLNNPVNLGFFNNNMNYIFVSSLFYLKNNVLYSDELQFKLENDNGFLFHPSVDMRFDDNDKSIVFNRLKNKRGLSPVRNNFHGLNCFVDKIELNLVDNTASLFHFSRPLDIDVLLESDNYFDQKRYDDLLDWGVSPLSLLLEFYVDKNKEEDYLVVDFASFHNLNIDNALNMIIDLEIFGMLHYNQFENSFRIINWAVDFHNSYKGLYDYDQFKIQCLAGVGDTVASINFNNNEMFLYGVDQVNITSRFNLDLYPSNKTIKLIDNKDFEFDGDIYLGDFLFSGNSIAFKYDEFIFDFDNNSILSFSDEEKTSVSLIHFDDAVLFVDSLNNKSGVDVLNDFPKFKVYDSAYLTYSNKPVNFQIDPFDINYLNDMSLSNLTFSGSLLLDSVINDMKGVLSFDDSINLKTNIVTSDSILLYKDNLLFSGSMFLSNQGLFASGLFKSNNLIFKSKRIELLPSYFIGEVDTLKTVDSVNYAPFKVDNAFINYFPYANNFLIKSKEKAFSLYSDFDFDGDLYFDGENLNGSGLLSSSNYFIESSHYYFTNESIMSADANFNFCYLGNRDNIDLIGLGVTVEHNLLSDSVNLFQNNNNWILPAINYSLGFESVVIDLTSFQLKFNNTDVSHEGELIVDNYNKPFYYNALSAVYFLSKSELCIDGVFPLSLKKFWLQPANNSFCVLKSGLFPLFKNATIIKKRRILKDKLLNNRDVEIKKSLKLSIIND